MGLDATAYEKAEHIPGYQRPDDDEDWDFTIVSAFAYEPFRRALDGMEGRDSTTSEGWAGGEFYRVSGREVTVSQSYGGHTVFRNELMRAAWGFTVEHWTDQAITENVDRPFYDLVWFADNEGTIGPVASRRLADAFETHRDRVRPLLERADAYQDWMVRKYDQWLAAFTLAADTGLVDFH